MPEIEGNIREAEARTQEARDALSGAENDAKEALRIAQEAEGMAQGASEVGGLRFKKNVYYCLVEFKLIYLRLIANQVIPTYINQSIQVY